jgi:hypothetical protein
VPYADAGDEESKKGGVGAGKEEPAAPEGASGSQELHSRAIEQLEKKAMALKSSWRRRLKRRRAAGEEGSREGELRDPPAFSRYV